jgi:anti-anti-sigma factor
VLTITIQDLGAVVILQCRGRIVRGEETSILCPAVRHAGRDVILDLKRVDAIDAAGIGALLSLQAAGVYLRLRDPSEAVREVLRLTRLETVFEICRSERTEVILGAIVQENGSESPEVVSAAK